MAGHRNNCIATSQGTESDVTERKPILVRLKNIRKASVDECKVKEESIELQVTKTRKTTTTTTTLPRVCKVCNRVFSCGRALGGHARSHKVKKEVEEVEDQYDKNGDWTSNFSSTKPTCPVCSKVFPSKQSMFGHLRCHPERQWRGIHPPPPLPLASKLSVQKDDLDNPTQLEARGTGFGLDVSSLQWGAASRRGQKRKRIASTDAVTASSRYCLEQEEKDNEFTLEEICEVLLSMKNEDIPFVEAKIVPVKNEIYSILDKLHASSCRDCIRSFSTHQALCGHRSSPIKDYTNNGTRNMEVHTIKIEDFPCRQEAFPREANRTGRKMLGFDLNELPEVVDLSTSFIK